MSLNTLPHDILYQLLYRAALNVDHQMAPMSSLMALALANRALYTAYQAHAPLLLDLCLRTQTDPQIHDPFLSPSLSLYNLALMLTFRSNQSIPISILDYKAQDPTVLLLRRALTNHSLLHRFALSFPLIYATTRRGYRVSTERYWQYGDPFEATHLISHLKALYSFALDGHFEDSGYYDSPQNLALGYDGYKVKERISWVLARKFLEGMDEDFTGSRYTVGGWAQPSWWDRATAERIWTKARKRLNEGGNWKIAGELLGVWDESRHDQGICAGGCGQSGLDYMKVQEWHRNEIEPREWNNLKAKMRRIRILVEWLEPDLLEDEKREKQKAKEEETPFDEMLDLLF